MDFNANISISETDFDTYVGDLIDSKIDIDDLASRVAENIDIDDITDSVASNLDYGDVADKVFDAIDINDFLDYSDIADHVSREIETITEGDIDQIAMNLLESYVPGNGCSLGRAFTDAIASGLKYILENDVENIRLTFVNMLFPGIIEREIEYAKSSIILDYVREQERIKKEQEEILKKQNEMNTIVSVPSQNPTSIYPPYNV